jgi:hypothetical protein
MEVASRIALAATPSIWGNPTVEHAGGNACVVSLQDNVGNPRTQLRSTASQDKSAMKSVMRMLELYEGKL